MRPPVYSRHTRRQMRAFAAVWVALLGGAFAYQFWLGAERLTLGAVSLWGGATVLLLVGAAWPELLRPAYHVWMTLSFGLNLLVSRLLLTAVFFVLLTPLSLLARLAQRDRLGRTARASYWWRLRAQAPREHFEHLYVGSDVEKEPRG